MFYSYDSIFVGGKATFKEMLVTNFIKINILVQTGCFLWWFLYIKCKERMPSNHY